MAMTDTADDFNATKDYFRNKKVFVHLEGLDCGHYHVTTTKQHKTVDCYACLKLIENGKHKNRE